MTQETDDEQTEDALKYFFVAASNLLTKGLGHFSPEDRQKILNLIYQGRVKIEIRYSALPPSLKFYLEGEELGDEPLVLFDDVLEGLEITTQ